MVYKKYPKYKDSGIEWIGKVPEGWGVCQGKYILKIYNSINLDIEQIADKNGDILYIKVDDLNYIKDKEITSSTLRYFTSTRNPCFTDLPVLLFPKRGAAIFTNKLVFCKQKYMIDPNLMAITIYQNVIEYIYFFIVARKLGDIADVSTIPQINNKHINPLLFLIPPLPEQQSIAIFLDHKTSLIDTYIQKKQKQVEHLKEYRTATINQAVTKGLNPNATIKDSGIEWIGEIPEHWELKKLKSFTLIRYGVGEPPEYVEDGIPFIRATNIDAGKITLNNMARVNPETIPSNRIIWLRKGDIIVVRSGAYTGDSTIIPNEFYGSIAGFDLVVSCKNEYSEFIAYALLSEYLKTCQIDLEKMRAAQPHLNAEELGNCIVLIPPLPEQQAIADYLDTKTQQIDTLVAKIEAQIAFLQEYRTTLISEATTGKIDVRDYA